MPASNFIGIEVLAAHVQGGRHEGFVENLVELAVVADDPKKGKLMLE